MSEQSKFSHQESAERLLGSRVLEFELTEVLGAGGMSVVYRGRHRVTGQEVAIKVLPPELAVHDELKARFVEEARVLAHLEHPNIVSLNNFCESSGRLCLVMQFVEGRTFEQLILAAAQSADGSANQGKLPWPEVTRIGVEVLKALEYAHAQQVVHRDIKPSNVLIRADKTVKVTDFGIAKMLGNSRLTSTGQTMGTVRYMSPEQVRGKPVDARTDVYSLGVTLFEGFAGRTPFEGDNQFDIMQQHLSKRPASLRALGVDLPFEVERVLGRALEKDPAARFQDARSFREALEQYLPKETTAFSSRPARRGRGLVLVLSGSLAVVGAVVAFVVQRPLAPIASSPTAKEKGGSPSTKRPLFLSPHLIAGVSFAVDQTFETDGLRLQSTAPRDVEALRKRYQNLVASLRTFMQKSDQPAVRAQADILPAPLTLALVPQAILDKPELWPGFALKPDASYPSRYVDAKRTLFVADTLGFEDHELPYGVALHVLAPIRALSNDALLSLAERFETFYGASKSPK